MKLVVKTGEGATGDIGGFEERELRRCIKSKDTEAVVAQFLILLREIARRNDEITRLRGGREGPTQMCLKCKRFLVWVGEGEARRWVCPNCLWGKSKI